MTRILIGAALLAMALAATEAGAQIPADKISHDIAQRYGVTVLKVTPMKLDGRDAYAVAVMNPGGNDNGAFAVITIVVDAETGALAPQFAPAAATAPPGDDTGPIIRSMTAREYRPR